MAEKKESDSRKLFSEFIIKVYNNSTIELISDKFPSLNQKTTIEQFMVNIKKLAATIPDDKAERKQFLAKMGYEFMEENNLDLPDNLEH